MPRFFRALTLLLPALAFGGVAASAFAGVVAMPPPGPARIAGADVVVVGKVEAIEPQDVKVGNTMYRIAVVKIKDGVRGIKDEKTLRIGFVPLEKPNPKIFVSGGRPVQLEAGQEGLFLLKKHDKENFYTIPGIVGYFVNSDKNTGFDKEVQAARAAAKVVADPQAGLKSKDASERLLAAAILIDRYRTFRGPKAKLEPIDEKESKLILKTLADADWQAAFNFTSLQPHAGQLFQRLGVTAKDGFTVVAGANYQAAAQQWVRDNAEKYRIQRYVASDGK